MGTIKNYLYLFSGDLEYILILVLTFLAVVLLVGGLAYLLINRDRVGERLSKLLAQPKSDQLLQPKKARLVEKDPDGLAASISRSLHKLVLATPAGETSSIRLRLMQAGMRSKQAFANFLCLKIGGALLLSLFFLLSSLVLKITVERVGIMILLAVFGFFLPDIVLFLKIQKRKTALARAFPDALDLMVVCVEAGLGLDMTFKRVGEEIRSISKDLSDEFLLTNLEIRSGRPRDESFKNMSVRTGVPEIGQLMTMIIQTNRFGTSIGKALRVHSDSMRTKRRQTAEETAAKAAVKLLFPLVFFIFPALFVVILGPGVIQIIRILLPTLGGE
ncbi:MAG TPA: type II secretion system F family protein [Desulfuromonadales bacterium]|nr:type II secretion system F family protein [Desulfuromonadales bacterium]